MSTEAHKLIGISLSKIAQSRASRGGVSLHKNLLVATVLHKARYIFMEEAYQIVHGNSKALSTDSPLYQYMEHSNSERTESLEGASDGLSSDAGEWRGEGSAERRQTTGDETSAQLPKCTNGSLQPYKSPPSYQAHIELTYLNLDKCTEKNGSEVTSSEAPENNTLKRRHSEWEVEEAVLSILPKRAKPYQETASFNSVENSDNDFVFLDEADFLHETTQNRDANEPVDKLAPSMEIDRLSSLVSIFSFANLTEVSGICDEESGSKSVPDQCSAQAKDNNDVLQPMPTFLAMTV